MLLHARRHCFDYIIEITCSYSQNAVRSQILKKPKSYVFEQKKQESLGFWLPKEKLFPSIGVYLVLSNYILMFNSKITFSPTFEQRMDGITRKSHTCMINTNSWPLPGQSYQHLLSD